jgi:hypothetical protein
MEIIGNDDKGSPRVVFDPLDSQLLGLGYENNVRSLPDAREDCQQALTTYVEYALEQAAVESRLRQEACDSLRQGAIITAGKTALEAFKRRQSGNRALKYAHGVMRKNGQLASYETPPTDA